MIQFKNVSKTYKNGTKALHDFSIQIADGEFVFVLGASGAGKSTFLKLLMREEVASSGEVIINGCNLNTIQKRKIPYFRRKLGIVFQDFRLIPNMRVYDNIAFAMRVIGAKEKDISKRVAYVLSLVGLSSKAKAFPNQLSGGEQQRVALARALVNEADIIIADEPTGNIDPEMSFEIVDLLNHINANGTTVIMVTHEHNLVQQFADKRIVTLKNGTVVSDTARGDTPLQPADPVHPPVQVESSYYDVPNESVMVEHFLRNYGTEKENASEEEILTELHAEEVIKGRLDDPAYTSTINISEVYEELYAGLPEEEEDDAHSDVLPRPSGSAFSQNDTDSEGGEEE